MSRYEMCPNCGHRLRKIGPDEYICEYCYESDDDDIPEGCAACGGPYPDCKDGCSMFDED